MSFITNIIALGGAIVLAYLVLTAMTYAVLAIGLFMLSREIVLFFKKGWARIRKTIGRL